MTCPLCGHLSHLTVATLLQRQLIRPPVLAFLLLDVLPNDPLIATHRGHEVAPGPEVLPHEVPRTSVWRQVLLPLNVNYSCRFGRLLVRRRTVRWALLWVLKT